MTRSIFPGVLWAPLGPLGLVTSLLVLSAVFAVSVSLETRVLSSLLVEIMLLPRVAFADGVLLLPLAGILLCGSLLAPGSVLLNLGFRPDTGPGWFFGGECRSVSLGTFGFVKLLAPFYTSAVAWGHWSGLPAGMIFVQSLGRIIFKR